MIIPISYEVSNHGLDFCCCSVFLEINLTVQLFGERKQNYRRGVENCHKFKQETFHIFSHIQQILLVHYTMTYAQCQPYIEINRMVYFSLQQQIFKQECNVCDTRELVQLRNG